MSTDWVTQDFRSSWFDDQDAMQYTAQEIANDQNLWEEYFDPEGNYPFDSLSFDERCDVILECWPDTPDERDADPEPDIG